MRNRAGGALPIGSIFLQLFFEIKQCKHKFLFLFTNFDQFAILLCCNEITIPNMLNNLKKRKELT